MSKSRSEGRHIEHTNPDRGPPMLEGAHHWDKGYSSDDEMLSPRGDYPDNHMRGNAYNKLQNEIDNRDSKKLKRAHFTKIA